MSGLVRASEAVALALHATAIIAGADGARLTAAAIAERLAASEAHLAKVLQRLAKAGLVRGTRGPHGGFMLTKPAARITLRQVYEAIEGPLGVRSCMIDSPVCGKTECQLGDLFERLSEEASGTLGKMTLADVQMRFDSD